MKTLTAHSPKIDIPLNQWKPTDWEDYEIYRDTKTQDPIKLYYYQHHLLLEMGSEGINHSSINDLFTMLFFIWFGQINQVQSNSFGGCLLEKTGQSAAAPDIMLYIGEDYPRRQTGERRYIDLDQWRVPDLVGEISDTTLSKDLDEKKHLYAALNIPEYWVIDVVGRRVFAFQLQNNLQYQECTVSQALSGLPISLLEETLAQLTEGGNISAANWFFEQVNQLNSEED